MYFFAGKREQTMTVTSVEVPNSESHSGAEKKRNSSEGSIEAYPYANEDTNETIEGKIQAYYVLKISVLGFLTQL